MVGKRTVWKFFPPRQTSRYRRQQTKEKAEQINARPFFLP
jgi:hypothetical protein